MKDHHYIKIFFSFIFIIICFETFACSCGPRANFKTTNDLKSYDFIAHVKITKLAAIDTTQKFMQVRTNGEIKAMVIEQFKGSALTDFLTIHFRVIAR